jgi:hypothetical protein
MVEKTEGSRANMAPLADDPKGPTIRFLGTGLEDYEDFKIAAQFKVELEPEDRQAKALVGMLGIDALKTLSGNRPAGGFTTIDEYWTALDGVYSNGAKESLASEEFEALRQKGTPINEFIVKFERLTGILEIEGTLKAQMFKDKLNNGIRNGIVTAGLRSYGDMKTRAIELAPIAEREYKRSLKQREQLKATKEKAKEKKGADRDNKGRWRPEKGGMGRGRSITCYNCNKTGHMARDCHSGQGGGAGYAWTYYGGPSRAPTPQLEYYGGGRAYETGPPQGWQVYQPQVWRMPPPGTRGPERGEELKDAGRFEPAESVQEEE